uniref:Chitin-binding type-2 domain-containing protein n=1 Tax=Strigamia maritima TaxID=126957 RepID=T1JLX2_STRMM
MEQLEHVIKYSHLIGCDLHPWRKKCSFLHLTLSRYLAILVVWHICDLENRKSSFLCTNGTIYNQIARVCDWWFNVDCGSSANFYSINDDLYKNPGSVIPEEDEDEFEFQTPQQFFFNNI